MPQKSKNKNKRNRKRRALQLQASLKQDSPDTRTIKRENVEALSVKSERTTERPEGWENKIIAWGTILLGVIGVGGLIFNYLSMEDNRMAYTAIQRPFITVEHVTIESFNLNGIKSLAVHAVSAEQR